MLICPQKNIDARRCPSFSDIDAVLPCAHGAKGSGRPRRYQLALLLGALFSLPAGAAQNDMVQPFVGLNYSHDDNLLRSPDGDSGFDNVRGDSMRVVDAGLLVDKTLGRQHINVQGSVTDVRFGHFTQLDYKGKDVNANWDWRLGNHLDGKIGSAYSEVLAPYNDVHSNERNLRTSRHDVIDGGWQFHPSWRVRTAVTRDSYDYELVSQRSSDRIDDGHVLGLDYQVKSGNSIGLQLGEVKGRYQFLRPVEHVGGVDDGYDQREVKLKVGWNLTELLNVRFLGGRVRRNYLVFENRDATGNSGRLDVKWTPRLALTVNSAAWREFGAVDNNIASYSENSGASVGSAWDATVKLRFEAKYRYEKRAFKGLFLSAETDVHDVTRQATLSASYVPATSVLVSTSLDKETRTGAVLFGSSNYHSKRLAVNVNMQF